MRDQRDPAVLGAFLLDPDNPSLKNLSTLERADLANQLSIPDVAHGETSQSQAQRDYRAEHERKAAQGIKASVDLLTYMDHPDRMPMHPGALVADVDLPHETRPSVSHNPGAFDKNGDLQQEEGE